MNWANYKRATSQKNGRFSNEITAILLSAIGLSSQASAAAGGGIPHFPNFYLKAVESLGLSAEMAPVASGVFILAVLTLFGLFTKGLYRQNLLEI